MQKTATQSKNDMTVTKRVTKLNITSTKSFQRSTISSTNRDRFHNKRVKKMLVLDDVMRAARIKKGVETKKQGNHRCTSEIDRRKDER